MKNQFMILILLAFSCTSNCRIDVTKSYIESQCELYNGFNISRIATIKSFSGKIPSEFVLKDQYEYSAHSEDALDIAMKSKLIKVNFNEVMPGYSWVNKENRSLKSDTIPFQFKKNTWYLISNVQNHGTPSMSIFIFVDGVGSFNLYIRERPTNY